MKIAVIGYSGSGKSTLAEKLGKKYQLPVLYLDKIHFLPGWKVQDPEKELKTVRQFMREEKNWIIDGNYIRLDQDVRLKQADRILFLNFNRVTCLSRCVRRYMEYYGSGHGAVRESMAEGCPEKLDWEFVLWILKKSRTAKARRHYRIIRRNYPDKLVEIRNQKQLDAYLKKEGLDSV